MLVQTVLAAAALLAAVTSAPAPDAALAVTMGPAAGAVRGPCGDPGLPVLLEAASAPVNTPERRAARDQLFRELVPRLRATGRGPTESEAQALLAGVGGYPCAGGRLRVHEARICGEAATLSLAAEVGGCSLLMRRRGPAWEVLMALGWTLGGG